MKRILITGAAGAVGGRLRKSLRGLYAEIRLSDITEPKDLAPGESFVQADLADFDAVQRAVNGVDGIIHLGGLPVEFAWEQMLATNIVGNYNMLEAARRAGTKRFVFASSNQVIGFLPRNRRVGTDVTVRPSSRYGVTKAFGESLSALYADKHGLRVLCIRIGRIAELPEDERRLALWLSHEDFAQLVRIGLEHPDIHYEVVYGVSDNQATWYDNKRAYELGYKPVSRADDHRDVAMAAQALKEPDHVADRFMGARLCSIEYDGDLERSGR